jgi:regulator of nonsense transcripts 3
MSGGRRKVDNRQGTIDQDQEFKDFLESLTNPIIKSTPENDAHKEEKIKTTPLIEALREKKANKDKPQVKGGKHGRGESKEEATEKKILTKGAKDAAAAATERNKRPSKAERAAAAKEAVKVLNKEAASSKENTKPPATDKNTAPSATPERKRGNVNIAKSMLQRDLGIGPAANRRRGTKREVAPAGTPDTAAATSGEVAADKQRPKETPTVAVAAASSDKTIPPSPKKPSRAERRAFKATLPDRSNSKAAGEEPKIQVKAPPTILKKPQPAQNPTTPKGPAASRAPPTEPAASRVTTPHSVAPAKSEVRPQVPVQPAVTSPASAPTGRQGFLKHANPSQGITEPLLEEALKVFGAVEKVEIDKRKGFAYVDFADSEGLKKAMAASPVKVAQGAVQVLERKEKVVRNRPLVQPHPNPHPHVHPGPHGPPTGPVRGRGGFMPRGRGRGGARGGGHVPSAPGGDVSQAAPAPAPAPVTAPATTNVAT